MKIVFDFAGVLFGWHPPSLLKRVLPGRATDETSAARWAAAIFQGYGGDWAEFDRGTLSPEALTDLIAQRTGLEPDEVQRVVDGVAAELQPIDATVALLRRLRDAGHTLYFLSNMPAPYADHLQACHPFVGWFSDGVFSARVGLIKPEPAIFDLAARRFAAAPDDLLFFDDVGANVDAARRAGWDAQLFTDAAGCEAELRRRGLMH
jgi:putative hydrolase of the HAD superfamily